MISPEDFRAFVGNVADTEKYMKVELEDLISTMLWPRARDVVEWAGSGRFELTHDTNAESYKEWIYLCFWTSPSTPTPSLTYFLDTVLMGLGCLFLLCLRLSQLQISMLFLITACGSEDSLVPLRNIESIPSPVS